MDFVVNHVEAAIEAKGTARVTRDHLKGLGQIAVEYPEVRGRVVVSLEPVRRRTPDGIDVLPAEPFVEELWSGEIL